jgi:hypothetical protein
LAEWRRSKEVSLGIIKAHTSSKTPAHNESITAGVFSADTLKKGACVRGARREGRLDFCVLKGIRLRTEINIYDSTKEQLLVNPNNHNNTQRDDEMLSRVAKLTLFCSSDELKQITNSTQLTLDNIWDF